MDRSVQHAFDAEEIMAYLDGELEPERAAALATHLVGCGDCQEIAKSFRAVSERMLSFEVQPASVRVSEAVLAALDSGKAFGPAAADHAGNRTLWKLAGSNCASARLGNRRCRGSGCDFGDWDT